MKILAFWDIYGRVGRTWFLREIKNLQKKYTPDFTIANVDNISSWRWPMAKHVLELEQVWVDVMCSWDHFFDNQKHLVEYLAKKDGKLIRPANFYDIPEMKIPWNGYKIVEKNWKKLSVIHLVWQVFMRFDVYNPFLKLEEILKNPEIADSDAVVVDFHRETTSEIWGLWIYFDGKISAVYGTHTHVQTNDDTILKKWTGFITDVWMNGPRNSIIWADSDVLKARFFTWINHKVVQSLDREYIVQWIFLEIDDTTKKTLHIEKIQILWTL